MAKELNDFYSQGRDLLIFSDLFVFVSEVKYEVWITLVEEDG
jgi:hypothetical protein